MRSLTRRDFLKTGLAAGACASLASLMPLLADKGKYNVLFIAVDDLRPQLGCYGFPDIHSPNIDKFAARGTVFKRAYCQQAVCSPSRTSLLTGMRPDTTKCYDLETHFRSTIPDVVALPEHFKNHGYHSQGLNKIYHGGLDDPQSWSVPHWRPGAPGYRKPENIEAVNKLIEQLRDEGKLRTAETIRDPETGVVQRVIRGSRIKGPSWEDPDVPDNDLADGMTADRAIEIMRDKKDEQFFLAVGFMKPHLPFVAPKKYYDLYPIEKIKVADNPFAPEDSPEIALTNWGELRQYTDIPKQGPLPEDLQKQLIRGYYACTSFVDAQIGRVVDELDKLGIRDKTIIVLWGDHGWQLGEHGLWCKHTNFEVATHSPLIISAPGQKNPGAKTDALVEFVDIYPTLCELAGLPLPKDLEGTSLVPVMNDPNRSWKKAAFSQYPRRGGIMGYTMRTDRYRFTEWAVPGEEPVAVELYDYETDPKGNVNIAGLPEHKELVAKLSEQLRAGWKAAKP